MHPCFNAITRCSVYANFGNYMEVTFRKRNFFLKNKTSINCHQPPKTTCSLIINNHSGLESITGDKTYKTKTKLLNYNLLILSDWTILVEPRNLIQSESVIHDFRFIQYHLDFQINQKKIESNFSRWRTIVRCLVSITRFLSRMLPTPLMNRCFIHLQICFGCWV